MAIYNDDGKSVKSEYLLNIPQWTAGSTVTDAVKQTTAVVDVLGYRSGKVVMAYDTTLSSTKKLNYTLSIQDSANNSDWNTAVVLASGLTIATYSTTTAVKDTYEVDMNLEPYGRYIKFNFTPDLTATDTDTCAMNLTFLKLGASALPAL